MSGGQAMDVAMCFIAAALQYGHDPELLPAIYEVERGRPGMVNENTNGTADLGFMQINTIWVPVIAHKVGASEQAVREQLVNNACYSIATAAWILRTNIDDVGELWAGVGRYHSRTPGLHDRYIIKVKAQFNRLKASPTAQAGGR